MIATRYGLLNSDFFANNLWKNIVLSILILGQNEAPYFASKYASLRVTNQRVPVVTHFRRAFCMECCEASRWGDAIICTVYVVCTLTKGRNLSIRDR